MSDLTELTALQKQIRWKENLAALGEMSAGIAHEFKNALATISGYAQMIRSEAQPGDIHESAEKILDQTRALTHVVTEFLRFAKPLEICYETVPMQTLVERVAEDLHETFPAMHGRMRRRVSRASRRRGADPPGADLNLTRNAAEARPGMRQRAARIDFRHYAKNSAAANGSESASRTTAPEFPSTICPRSSCPSTLRNPKAQVWASPWSKRSPCSTAAVSRPATGRAEAPSSCSGYLCGRSPRRLYSPRRRPASKLEPWAIPCLARERSAMRTNSCGGGHLAAALHRSSGARVQEPANRSPRAGQPAQAQASRTSGQDSLAAAARKAREQKKDLAKTTKVFTNDNISHLGRRFFGGRVAPRR